MSVFIIASVLLLMLALAVVLLPLFRSPMLAQHRRLHKAFRDGLLSAEEFASKFQAIKDAAGHAHARPPRSNKLLALAMLLLMPLAGYWLYDQIGTPTALDWPDNKTSNVNANSTPTDIPALEARTREQPEQRIHWMRLASAYTRANRFAESAAALQQALDLTSNDAPERADILASLAENQLFAATGNIPQQALANLGRALQLDAQNVRALWLSGAVALQQQDYRTAIGHWQTLLPLVDDAEVRDSIQQQLNQALAALHSEAGADMNAVGSAIADSGTNADATDFAIDIDIDFSAELLQTLEAHQGSPPVLFVFARRPDRPGPPLAIQRVDEPQAPMQLSLSNAQAMVPGNDLGSVGPGGNVEIVARLSWSGNASPASGDWQAVTTTTLDKQQTSLTLTLADKIE